MRLVSMSKLAKSSSGSTPNISDLLKSSTSFRSFRPFLNSVLIYLVSRLLHGNPAKAERVLGWKRRVDFDSLVEEMVDADLKASASLIEDQN